jgi:4-hydroxymandelate oxidase
MNRVFSAGPPARVADGAALVGSADGAALVGSADGGLRLRSVHRQVFDGSAFALPPEHRGALEVYLADLVRPYGIALHEERLADGHSYGDMGESLIRAAVRPDQPVDLLILAFAIPDLRPGRATATYLSHVCPGDPLAFAICDQGAAAAFTGLRLLREYGRTGASGRGLLLVVEQAALPYDEGAPVARPTGHTACALLCDSAGRAGLRTLTQHAGVPPEEVAARLADEVARLAAEAARTTLILGGGLPPDSVDPSLVDQLRVAPAGRPYTGIWSELGEELSEASAGRVLVAEYEPQLRYLCLSAFDLTDA